jgi:predicted acyl esterase
VQFRDGSWHTESQWPPASTGPVSFYLHATSGAGRLDHSRPLNETPEKYLDDPSLDETRMLQNPESSDPARLTYKTAPFLTPFRIAGRPYLDIHATSDQTSTHYDLLICDIDPTGKWTIALRGFGNARYRDGLEVGKDLPVNQPYEFKLNARDDDYTFAKGHAIGLVLSSSNAVWALPDAQRANNSILHTAARPSALVLPVVGTLAATTTTGSSTPSATPLPNTSTGTGASLLVLAFVALASALAVATRRATAGRR